MAADEPGDRTEGAPKAPAAEAGAAGSEASSGEAEAPVTATERREDLSPKERRRRERSRHRGESSPPRDAAERARERVERRRKRAAARRAWRARQRERRRLGRGGGTAASPPARDDERGRPRVRQGLVVSDKPDKTITVRIDAARRHRAYKKIVRESSTLRAHDERNEAHAGDTVRVVESRPISRSKRWRLVEVLERAR